VINDKARGSTWCSMPACAARDESTCHPLVNTMTTSIGRDDLSNFSRRPGTFPRIEPVANAPD